MEAPSATMNLTKWQQKMIKDFFGVTTSSIDVIEDVRDWVKYRTPSAEALSNWRVQRMYLEDAQKEQIAKIVGMRADKMCDFIELDPEVVLKYAAMHRSGLLYAPLRKAD